jgi:glycosyltransferase involved in cell wall biosynthesis
MSDLSRIGIVAIGRNEGERLKRCLESARRNVARVVYVDSGSTDNSVALARQLGCDVVELDLQTTFTAARARNAGFDRLSQAHPDLRYVQFVDGDCEIAAGWLDAAADFLDNHPKVAVVCGRRRERFPEKSVYNWLCDVEWNTPVGEAKACGGDALMRTDAFVQAGRYRPDVIAGEEPELCVRLRAAGWQVWRLDQEMTLHDAAMTRFGQWWRRAIRAGYASALGAFLHGAPPERHQVWQSQRTWIWGLLLPLGCLILTVAVWPWGLVAWLIYPAQFLRQTIRAKGALSERAIKAAFQLLARFPEAIGQIRFTTDRLLGRNARLIEYK